MTKSNQALVSVIVVCALVVGGFWYLTMQQTAVAPTPISTSATIIVPSPLASVKPSGSVKPAASPMVEANLVTMTKNTFVPGALNIKVGETVTWVNTDTYAHDVVADDQSFNSGNLTTGQKYSYTFTKAGTVPYYCSIHPSMKGKIIVTD